MNNNEQNTEKNEKDQKTRHSAEDIIYNILFSILITMLALGALYIVAGWFDPRSFTPSLLF